MESLRSARVAILVAAASLVATGAGALASVSIPEQVQLNGRPLALRAAAVRSKFWIDVYACAIYTAPEERQVARDPGAPLIIDFRIMTSRLPDRPPDAWERAIGRVVQRTKYETLAANFRDLRPGDVLRFEYVPETGTTVNVGSRLLFATDDFKLMAAILELLFGEDPVSEDLKQNLKGDLAGRTRQAALANLP